VCWSSSVCVPVGTIFLVFFLVEELFLAADGPVKPQLLRTRGTNAWITKLQGGEEAAHRIHGVLGARLGGSPANGESDSQDRPDRD
jgi:hypothetical protein